MKEEIQEQFQLTSTNYSGIAVLYDCPPSFFKPCDRSDLNSLISNGTIAVPNWYNTYQNTEHYSSPSIPGTITGDCLTIVSSTSWTADDDYTMLLDALQLLQPHLQNINLRIWIVITGKGCYQNAFKAQCDSYYASGSLSMDYIYISLIYFQSLNDYATMLGSADIGLSIHFSSSEFDLPMKIVDMFGCGLPVIAYNYRALNELLTNNYGWLFNDKHQLTDVLIEVTLDYINTTGKIQEKRANVLRDKRTPWSSNWSHIALPRIKELMEH